VYQENTLVERQAYFLGWFCSLSLRRRFCLRQNIKSHVRRSAVQKRNATQSFSFLTSGGGQSRISFRVYHKYNKIDSLSEPFFSP